MNKTLINGDMLIELDKLEQNSVDAIVTDPPYELNFMNKGWDNSGISYQKETWEKCLRVLKPGGYLLAFAAPRTQHRIACSIEDAGFEIRDTIMWIFGSGFPKGMDISKQIDKRNGKQNEDFTKFGNYIKQCREAKGYSKNDIDKMMGTNTACSWWEGRMYKDDFIVQLPDKNNYYKLKEVLELDNRFDYLIEWQEAEREVIGTKESGCFNSQEKDRYTIGSSKSLEVDITIPSTDLAKQWQGWGTALKPSFEPIIVARKPCEGSCVDNVLKYGVGGINIDECRVPFENTQNPSTNPLYRMQNGYKSKCGSDTEPSAYTLKKEPMEMNVNAQGRFPANLILTYDDTDFDEVCGGFLENTSSGVKPYERSNRDMVCYRKMCNKSTSYLPGDSGSACRYFYCAKASKRDRNEGLNTGKNIHATVKPVSLMQYLVRLVSPKGAVILDPFMGSGSTGKAVAYENKDRDANYSFIGIELQPEYFEIAKQRIAFAEGDNTPLEEPEKEKKDQNTNDDSVKKQRLF